jgi:hypothetical protein
VATWILVIGVSSEWSRKLQSRGHQPAAIPPDEAGEIVWHLSAEFALELVPGLAEGDSTFRTPFSAEALEKSWVWRWF